MPKQDAVGVTQEEFAGGEGLATQLGDARPDIDVEVRAALEQLADPGQVLGVTTHVCADEGGARVRGNQIRQPVHD